MKESSFWHNVRKHVTAHMLRVENAAHPGTPDVFYDNGVGRLWLELKSFPFKSAYTLDVRPEQHAFALSWSRVKCATPCYLLLNMGPEEMWLLPHDGSLRHGTMETWKNMAVIMEGTSKWAMLNVELARVAR